MSKVMVGKKFKTNNCGTLTVMAYHNATKVDVKFDLTGYETTTNMDNVRKGCISDKFYPTVQGVGYLGVGGVKSNINKSGRWINNPVYDCWSGMLARCYSEKWHNKHPCYIGCTVDPRWYNLQVFAKWYGENFPSDSTERMELDKDTLIDGNKIYSPETCIFITKELNISAARAKTYTFRNPEGEKITFTGLVKFCESNNLNRVSMGKVSRGKASHHKGWTRFIG